MKPAAGAELEVIAAQAEQLGAPVAGDDQAAPGQVPPGQPAPASPNVGAIVFILSAFRELSCRVLAVESPKRTLNEANVKACADVLAPVADKYGIDLGELFSGPEGLALVTAGPLLWTAAQELSLELKAKRAKVAPAAEEVPAGAAA